MSAILLCEERTFDELRQVAGPALQRVVTACLRRAPEARWENGARSADCTCNDRGRSADVLLLGQKRITPMDNQRVAVHWLGYVCLRAMADATASGRNTSFESRAAGEYNDNSERNDLAEREVPRDAGRARLWIRLRTRPLQDLWRAASKRAVRLGAR